MIKRSVVIMGHATSVRLEPEFWQVIDLICSNEGVSFAQLLNLVEKKGLSTENLASSLRILCMRYSSKLEPFSFQEFFK